jgi:hypothetical protein
MNEIQIRIPCGTGQRLLEELRRPASREPVAFGFVSQASTPSREIICLRGIRVPPEDAFLPSLGHGARWSGRYMIGLLNEAMASQSGLFVFHAHPGGIVRMSTDDVQSAKQLLPKFQLIVPNRPHGSLVFGTDSGDGLVLMPGENQATARITVRQFAERMVDWPLPESSLNELLRFRRQPLVRGALSRAILRRMKVVVVGQSGGGTHVSLQLAQHGFGEIYGIDDDRIDEGNLISGIGFSERDAAEQREKISVLRERISHITQKVRYVPVRNRVPEQGAINILKMADIIIGCVNNLHARADLQEFALRYAVPYVDVGLILKTEDDLSEDFPPINMISGNIFTYVPGSACMWCTGFLSEDKLAEETDRRGRPYLRTKDNADAHVLSFNGLLASQAVNDVLNLIMGFSAVEQTSTYRKYDGFKGTLLPCIIRKNEKCKKCMSYLAAGDPIWAELVRSVSDRAQNDSATLARH